MQKILIMAPKALACKLEEKLRRKFDVETTLPETESLCQIRAKIRRGWITICSFARDENLKDILTMFEVNYELKKYRGNFKKIYY